MVLYSLNIVFSCGWVYPSTLLLVLPLFVLRLVPLLRFFSYWFICCRIFAISLVV